jgi:hypothetical protein
MTTCQYCSHSESRFDEYGLRMASYCDVIGLRTAPLFYCDAWERRRRSRGNNGNGDNGNGDNGNGQRQDKNVEPVKVVGSIRHLSKSESVVSSDPMQQPKWMRRANKKMQSSKTKGGIKK